MITHAYSVREPWGWLTIDGFKLCEIRSRPFAKNLIGQWVALHCSSNSEVGDANLMEDVVMIDQEIEDILEDEKWDDDKEANNRLFGYSEIIGLVKIVGSVYLEDEHDTEALDQLVALLADDKRSPRQKSNIEPDEWLCPDAHHWVIGDVHRFKTPIQCLGRLGIWKLPPALKTLVNQQAKKQPHHPRGESVATPIIFEKPRRAHRV